MLVEKILRVQPDVKKLFLLIRASDVESAKLRIENEVKYLFLAIFSLLKVHFVDNVFLPLVNMFSFVC